jgi:hypothetical protein
MEDVMIPPIFGNYWFLACLLVCVMGACYGVCSLGHERGVLVFYYERHGYWYAMREITCMCILWVIGRMGWDGL